MIRILPDGKSFQADRGESLLEVLTGAGIFLKSDCGGKGLCGKCLVRIPEPSPKSISPPEDAESGSWVKKS